MDASFTLHCVSWNKGASLLQEVRASACEIGLLSPDEALTDEVDERCCHAMVLSESGKAIGCARIKPAGIIERMAVLPHENRTQIEQALQLAAWLQEKSLSHCA
jgi:hypothetical protein